MSLGVNEESHFVSLAHALERADWLNDTRFAERANRKAHAAELSGEIEAELLKRTAEDWEPILQNAGVPSARLRSMPEALASPQIQTRGFVQTLDSGAQVPTLPFRLGRAQTYRPRSDPPKLGQHTDDVIAWLAKEAP